MGDKKDLQVFAEIWAAANHTRSLAVSAYIRYITRAITVLAKRTIPGKSANAVPDPTNADDSMMLLPSRRINDLLWKRILSKAS